MFELTVIEEIPSNTSAAQKSLDNGIVPNGQIKTNTLLCGEHTNILHKNIIK